MKTPTRGRLDADQLDIPGAEHEPIRGTLERKARAPLKPQTAQKPCDDGLFSDTANQLDLMEMLR
ncbi:MAG: hypothetical protein Q7R45_07245 [Sulfuricaulis sp.]|nr:hypothetical protein [Sulfuricaulis sp.]